MKRLLVFGVILIAFAAGAGFVIGGMVDQHRPRRTPLSVAVDDGDVNAVKSLLAHGADPNEGDEYLPPLFLAVGNDRVAIVRLLLDAGADPNRENSEGQVPTDLTNNCAVLDALISHGASPNVEAASRNPLIVELAKCPQPQYLEHALAQGADPNAHGPGGTPLLWAALHDDPAFATALLRAGAKPNPAGTPITVGGALDLVTQLHGKPLTAAQLDQLLAWSKVEAGTRAEIRKAFAVRAPRWSSVPEAFLYGGDGATEIHSLGTYSPLFAAALSGNATTVRALLAAGADPSVRNAAGTATAADVAQLMGHSQIVALLGASGGTRTLTP